MENAERKRIPFAVWEVEGTEYKLKLSTSQIIKLEDKYKINLLTIITSGDIPPLKIMLEILHASMLKFNHSIKYETVCDMFDVYVEEGGSQVEFFTNVLMPVFSASGFFTPAQSTAMEKNIEEAKEQLQ